MSVHRFTDDLDLRNGFKYMLQIGMFVFLKIPSKTFKEPPTIVSLCVLAPPTNPPYSKGDVKGDLRTRWFV